jgi:hypothetical protein
MPWCDACAKYLAPPTVNPDGTCPTCGQAVDAGAASPAATTRRGPWSRLPWHVKVLLVILAVYLTFRVGQGISWLAGEL